MLIEKANQLLDPEYMSVETGYCRLPNGLIHVSVLIQNRGVKIK